uniref:Uncharacterized protein n=1 Tax=Timema poppense TaxID=170557 RepID=A0A7R9CSN7_TIMPO|nr:unnamed protein product [Timema poppensis]
MCECENVTATSLQNGHHIRFYDCGPTPAVYCKHHSTISLFHTKFQLLEEKRRIVGQKGKKWRYIRMKLTPTFSSNKIKNMFCLVDAKAAELAEFVEQQSLKASRCIFSYTGATNF